MASYKVLVGNEGTYGSPVTHSDFVFFNDGETLTQKMDIYNKGVDQIMYPIGRIIETVGSFNPNGHYPGTWVRLPKNYTTMTEGDIPLQGVAADGTPNLPPMGLTLLDGSQWDMIYHHDTAGGYWAATSDCLNFDPNSETAPTKFGRMQYVNNYYNANHTLEFIMTYDIAFGGGVDGPVADMGRWIQQSSPFSGGGHNNWNMKVMAGGYVDTTTITAADGTTTTNTDIQRGLYVPWAAINNWTGLGRCRPNANATNCYFSGNRGMSNWFYPLGSKAAWKSGHPIPGNHASTGKKICSLYVRKDNAVLNNLNAGKTYGETAHILTVDEMPLHSHRLGYTRTGNFSSGTCDNAHSGTIDNYYTSVVGSNQAHNNMQPSIYINLWERVS